MRASLMFAAALAATVLSAAASACSFDVDCSPGSRCVKGPGSITGACVGGAFPGNRYDRAPSRDLLDPSGTVGNECYFDTQCGAGNRCAKGRYSTQGVCVRGR